MQRVGLPSTRNLSVLGSNQKMCTRSRPAVQATIGSVAVLGAIFVPGPTAPVSLPPQIWQLGATGWRRIHGLRLLNSLAF